MGIEFRIADRICSFELRSVDKWRGEEGGCDVHQGSEGLPVCCLRLRLAADLRLRLSELYDFATPEFLVLS